MDIVIEQYINAVETMKSSGVKLVDKTEWNDRLNICKTCKNYELYDNYKNEPIFKCTKCGCLGFKFMEKSAKCPLQQPKWR